MEPRDIENPITEADFRHQLNTLYAFLYNPMIHESIFGLVSLHRTREGAEKAMEWHRKECREEYAEIHGDFINFGHFESWKVETITIQD